MKRKHTFKYMVGSAFDAALAAGELLKHETCVLLSTLYEDGVHVDPVTTEDVVSVTVRRYRAHYFSVDVTVEFELDGVPSYSPYGLDGQNERPCVRTYLQPDEDTNPYHWYPSADGVPYSW